MILLASKDRRRTAWSNRFSFPSSRTTSASTSLQSRAAHSEQRGFIGSGRICHRKLRHLGRRTFFRPLRYEPVLRRRTWNNGFPRRPDRAADRTSHLTRCSRRSRLSSSEQTRFSFTASAVEVSSATREVGKTN